MNNQFVVATQKEDAQSFKLPCLKDERFKITLDWDNDGDLDIHALVCVNMGERAVIRGWEDIFSTYNVKRTLGGNVTGTLEKNQDGTFSTHNGALVHSTDARDGRADADEFMIITPSKLVVPPNGVIEIPVVVTIHEAEKFGYTFGQIQNARIVVTKDNGQVLMEARLTQDFNKASGVHMGSFIITPNGETNYHSLGTVFSGDFNNVIQFFAP